MDIQNDTDDPVDYDVDNGTGGGGSLVSATTTTASAPPAFVCPMEPKFKLGSKSSGSNKVSFDLSKPTQSHRLIFLITPAAGQQTMLIVPSVPPGTKLVKIESSGTGYYRAAVS